MRHRALANLVAAPLLLGSAGPAPAYDQAGHFYTSYALVRAEAQKELTLIALCAQLPDMASDIDAVAVYKSAAMGSPLSWLRWALKDRIDSADTRRMVTVQHVLHALTGGDAEAVERVARASIKSLMKDLRASDGSRSSVAAAPSHFPGEAALKERASALCALGFAFHFYGDSLAHRKLADPSQMYPTGRGHAADIHYPDYPMCDTPAEGSAAFSHCTVYQPGSGRRFAAWLGLWDLDRELLDVTPVGPEVLKARERKKTELIQLSAGASDFNDWGEAGMRKALGGSDGAVKGYTSFILSQRSDRSCQNVLASALLKLQSELGVFKALSCADVWSRYAATVRKELQAEPRARAPLGERTDFDAIYLESPLTDGPVSAR